MHITDGDAARWIIGAGFTGENRIVALAVSIAEAGDWRVQGRPIDAHAVGDVALETATWGPSVGAMQIRSLRSERGTGGVRDELANLDPATNYRHAEAIWRAAGGSFRPWSCWLNGIYRTYLVRAEAAVRAAGPISFTLRRYLYWRPELTGSKMLHGEDVRWVQVKAGLKGGGPHGVDGWYGPYTEAAVKRYQQTHRLAVDGIVGPQTLHAMDPSALWTPAG